MTTTGARFAMRSSSGRYAPRSVVTEQAGLVRLRGSSDPALDEAGLG